MLNIDQTGNQYLLILSEIAAIALDGRRAMPGKLQNDGFTFKYPELETALRNLLA